MLTVLQTIRILVIIQVITTTRCQDGFINQDFMRLSYSANDANINSHSFNANTFRDSQAQIENSRPGEYQMSDETAKANNDDYLQRYTRQKKLYRIKNPFHHDENAKVIDSNASEDSGTGASNQYAAMQYSLPPEEFLRKLRADNEYFQQQISTPAPNLGYTATPLPQYQYSTILPTNHETNNQPNNPVPLETKSSLGGPYLSSPSPYQYSTANNFLDNVQSTPSPVPSMISISTPLNNGQYSSQPSSYVSSSSSIFVSNSPSQQSYVSSPYSIIQTGSPDYSNKISSTIGSNPVSYDNNDYSAGRYALSMQQQYETVYTSTTTTPAPAQYMDQTRDLWLNNMNSGINATPKSLQDTVYSQNYPYQRNQQDGRIESNSDNLNSETHRISSLSTSSNVYTNQDNTAANNVKMQVRNTDRDTNQPDLYSNGDFGWKLTGKKPLLDVFSDQSLRYFHLNSGQSDGPAVSQMNFHMDTGKPYNYNQISKSAPESLEAQEFAQAAAKVHARFKQQQQEQQQQQQQLQQQQQYYFNNNNNFRENNNHGLNVPAITYFKNIEKPKEKYTDNNQFYVNIQNDLITAPPYYISSSRDNAGGSTIKPPFDHDKALKNIVPIDVSNVVGNSESKANIENNVRYAQSNYDNGQIDQNARHYGRPAAESFYKDKNDIYGMNIRAKEDDYNSDKYKQHDSNIYGKPDSNYNSDYLGTRQVGFLSQQNSNNILETLQPSNIQQMGLYRTHTPMSDFSNILKFSDIPYKLTQGLNSDALKLQLNFDQGGTPTSLPIRLNQNVGSHQLDVSTNLLNKLIYNRQSSMNRPDIDGQVNGLVSTINGFKVANPYNVDLKVVADMLKGKLNIDEPHMTPVRDQYNQPGSMKIDITQLQSMLKNENLNSDPINDSLTGNSYLDVFNTRMPYQGVKYSRSQEEEEPIVPITDNLNSYPIGAVIEQDDAINMRDIREPSNSENGNDIIKEEFKESRKPNYFSGPLVISKHRRPILSLKHSGKVPKSDVDEPYPLLKPPPRSFTRNNRIHIVNKFNRRLRAPKLVRLKTEPLFEAGSDLETLDTPVPILLKPPEIEAKSDTVSSVYSAPAA